MPTSRYSLKIYFLYHMRQTLHLGSKRHIFLYSLLFVSISLSISGQQQTFRYFDVKTLKNLVILTPKNITYQPARPANEFNLYSIKNQEELNNQFRKSLRTVFPQPDTSLIQLFDSIAYKGIFRKELKIYYCEYKFSPENLPSVHKIENKLYQFFVETQKMDLSPCLYIDTLHFEQSNCGIYRLSSLFK